MTLSFSWATNANYSTGPDAGTPTKVDPASTANGFIRGTIAAPQHINFLFDGIGDQLAKAVDGIGGGTYTLTAPLIFDDDEIRIIDGARLVVTGTPSELAIEDSGTLFVDATSVLEIEGNFLLSASAQGVVGPSASLRIDDAEDLTINSDANAEFILTMTPQAITLDGSGVATWWPLNPPCAGFVQVDVAAANQIAFPINLPPGDDIASIVVTVNGAGAGAGHASLPAGGDRLKVQLVSVNSAGTPTVLATRADQSGSVGAYDVSHTIIVANGALDSGTMPRTLADDVKYYVLVSGETGANAVSATTVVTDIRGSCVARAYRSRVMAY